MTDAVLELFGDGEARPALERQAAGSASGPCPLPRLSHGRGVRAGAGRLRGRRQPRPADALQRRVDDGEGRRLPGDGSRRRGLRPARDPHGGWDAAVIATPPTARGLADALLGVMRDPELGRRLGEAGSARVASIGLDWSRSASALVDGYARILARARARRGLADVGVGLRRRPTGAAATAPSGSRASSSCVPSRKAAQMPVTPTVNRLFDHALGEEDAQAERGTRPGGCRQRPSAPG